MRSCTFSILLATAVALNAGSAAARDAATAQWIWDSATPSEIVYFRLVINVVGSPKSCSIVAACDNQMVAFVNGQKVLENRSWEQPVRADISMHLRPGENIIAIAGRNAGGPAGLVGRIDVKTDLAETSWVTDDKWLVATKQRDDWRQGAAKEGWAKAHVVGPIGSEPWTSVTAERLTAERLTAARVPREVTATPAESVTVLKGFEVELLYSVPMAEQGSWVSLTVDPKGRLITSDQYGKLYRITPPNKDGPDQIQIETLAVDVGTAHGLLYAFDSLYVVAGEKEQGLYRVRDTNGDDQFDTTLKLRTLKGGGEHGPHAVILSPDGKSLYICAGNHTDLTEISGSLLTQVWQEDQLLPRMWDAGGHAVGKLAPGGWICRTDPEGREFELVSAGFRNEFDIAFNADGELFTYDADMEWDIGSPWYRPTRVCHATAGSEFGWRSGTGKWPNFYPDSLPAAVDIGPGSPTGIVFGYGAKFPAKYQNALFVCDWSFGKLYAVHLQADGSSYTGQAELFATASPFALTDIVVNPHDGAIYFATGGRRTQSGLYRIKYTGKESTEKADGKNKDGRKLRTMRHKLEDLIHGDDAGAIETAWQCLSHSDRFVRFAARTVIEHRPVETWANRVVREKDVETLLQATLALARCAADNPSETVVGTLSRLKWQELTVGQRLSLLRVYGVTFARHGAPNASQRQRVLKQVNAAFPAGDSILDQELARVLIFLNASDIVERTVGLLQSSPTQEEQINYALFLRNAKEGWSPQLRTDYFEWFIQSGTHRGGHSFQGFLKNIRSEAAASMSDGERESLAVLIETPLSQAPPEGPPRDFVKKWTVAELLEQADSPGKRNFERGSKMFAAANCFKCHRVQGRGGIIGPDLTGVGKRFDNKYLLESLIEPSKVVSDQYQATVFVLEDGRTVIGKVANLGGKNMSVITNMLEPGKFSGIARDSIDEQFPSKTSMMPESLLDTLSDEEILDLLAFLKSGGDADAAVFQR
ncbi:MAG TPA: c-type cytochrome [Planctomycetes bacterium]|nr:c-type cytochrome [Planctomycetota bacterium]